LLLIIALSLRPPEAVASAAAAAAGATPAAQQFQVVDASLLCARGKTVT